LNIFHLLSGAPYGGVERQVERMVSALQPHKMVQRVMLRHNHARAERLAAIGAVAVAMSFPSRFAFLDRRKINSEIRRFNPDLVISWTADVAPFVEKGAFVHLGRIGSDFNGSLLANCDHLFTPSTSRADKAKNAQIPSQRVHVLPHLPALDAGAREIKPLARKKYFTPPASKLIVTAARLEKDSGLDVLFKALARLPDHYLWVAGDGDERELLEAQAHEAGVKPRTRFIGWHDDLAPIIAAGDVFVCPSPHEDVGDVVLEAWGAGAPVVAADALGPGLLIRDQDNGLLVRVGDPVGMAEAIKWLCKDAEMARKLGAAGKASVTGSYAADKIVPQYLDLFKKLASELAPKMGA